jgi:DNA polymerase-3 subunit gamma/tau
MFENVLGQAAVTQIAGDIGGGILAPSMLFFGPPVSGKGTAGLELGRILSCEGTKGAAWNCACPACARHRNLTHPDLLLFGSRPFSTETAAAAAAFLRESGGSARILFIRSVRKLLARFSPVLWEDDAKLGKLSAAVAALDEDLDEVETGSLPEGEGLKKLIGGMLKNVYKLEAGIGEHISVAQIRRAAYWSRLAPLGKRKLLLIENADRMQDSGRNALLKILEEPPETVTIVLTTARREGLIPTILSRLRPYRFLRREPAVEAELIRRVFRDAPPEFTAGPRNAPPGLIGAYLDSFLPVPENALRPLAAFFAASLAAGSAVLCRGRGGKLPEELVRLGRYTAPVAEAAGLGRPAQDIKDAAARVLEGTEQFAVRSLFSRFLRSLLGLVSEALAESSPGREVNTVGFSELWIKQIREAESAVGVYNQAPALALERLGRELRQGMAEL